MRRDREARPAPARKKRPIMLAAAGAALTVVTVGLIFVFPSNSVKAVAPTGAVTFTASSGNLSPAAPVVATIELTPRYVRIAPGATVPLKILATGRDGNSVAGAKAVWVSYEPGVATVSPEGLVTGVAVGGAVVTATSGGRSASAVVSVARPVVVAPAEPRTVKGSVTAHPATPPRATAAPARPAPGVLQMLVMPWAYVSIDGQARKQWTRGVDTLSAAVPHRVRFERDGFVTIDTVVKLLPGEQRLLRVQMIARTP